MKATTTAAALLILNLATSALAQEPTYRVVIALKQSGGSSATASRDEVSAAQRRVSQLLSNKGLGQVSHGYSTIPALAAVVSREGWTALSADPDVVRVDLDIDAKITASSVASVSHALDVQRMGFTGKGVTVAVIDSGIDASHRDLGGAIIDEACFCLNAKGEPCCPDGSSRQIGMGAARDDNGHGTHIAGIIAGRGRVAPKGMAPDADLVAIRIADKNGSTSAAAMLSALDWVASAHPEVQVVNMSVGTSATFVGACDSASSITSSLAAVALFLRDRGTVIIAAAGNSGSTEEMAAPACIRGFLAVGAVLTRDNLTASSNGCVDVKTNEDRVACFSNSSTSLGLLAPGAGIVSTSRGGGRATASGTSQAAGVVSGAVALLMEGAPRAHDQIDAALRDSGISVTDRRNGRATPRLDLRAALTTLGGL